MARRGRLEQAETLTEARALRRAELSQRQVAKQLGVARSTLQGWNARAAASDCPPALAQFLKSPEGALTLTRIDPPLLAKTDPPTFAGILIG